MNFNLTPSCINQSLTCCRKVQALISDSYPPTAVIDIDLLEVQIGLKEARASPPNPPNFKERFFHTSAPLPAHLPFSPPWARLKDQPMTQLYCVLFKSFLIPTLKGSLVWTSRGEHGSVDSSSLSNVFFLTFGSKLLILESL